MKSPQIKGGKEPGMKERLLKALFSRVSPEITQPTQTEISEKLTAGLSIVWLDRPASRDVKSKWGSNCIQGLSGRMFRTGVVCFINVQSEDAA